jgi:hypothetical protein
MKFNKKKYIENMLIERSHATIFPDIKCKNPKMKYPNLITIRSILNYHIVNFSLKVAAVIEKLH